MSFDNELYLSGSTSANGNKGTWKFYNPIDKSNSPVITSSYTIKAKNKKSISVDYPNYDNNGSDMSFDYRQDVDVFNMVYSDSNGQSFTVHWNTTTMTGYYIDTKNVKHCWNSSFQDVPC